MFYNVDSIIVLLCQPTEDMRVITEIGVQVKDTTPLDTTVEAMIQAPSPQAPMQAPLAALAGKTTLLKALLQRIYEPVDRALAVPEELKAEGEPYRNPLCLPLPAGYVYDARTFFADAGFLFDNSLEHGTAINLDYIEFAYKKATVYYPLPCVMQTVGLALLTAPPQGMSIQTKLDRLYAAGPGEALKQVDAIQDRFVVELSAPEGRPVPKTFLNEFAHLLAGDLQPAFASPGGERQQKRSFLGIVAHEHDYHFAFCVYMHHAGSMELDNLLVFNSIEGMGSTSSLKMIRFIVANFICRLLGLSTPDRLSKLQAINNREVISVPSPQQGATMNCGFYTTLFMLNFMRVINAGRATREAVERGVVDRILNERRPGVITEETIFPESLRTMMRQNMRLYKPRK